jgi:replicative DNA helicase
MAEKNIFSNDSEVAVLSIILNNPDMVHELNGLQPFMFSSNVHSALFLEIQEMVEKQIIPEPALIIAQMEGSNTIGKVGGKKYIEQLCNNNYNKDTLSEYRNIVIKAYKARTLVSI